jgi:hypothetical protein
VTDYGLLFRELAVPRLVGTPNHQKVRAVLKRELAARGFAVEEHSFSRRPSNAFWGFHAPIDGINLIARRPSGGPTVRPSVWLVAHYDSKGQPFSMFTRLLWIVTTLIALLTLWVSAILTDSSRWAFLFFFIAMAAGWLVNRVNDNSPGAVDNATALIAIFMTIDQLSPATPVGVVFPDAEEYGLVGARALAAERADLFVEAALINLDGLDDVGRPTAFLHRPGPIATAVAEALKAREWRWLPVIVDGIALKRVSRECVSILKGNWHTMRVIHRPQDSAARVRLDGAAIVAAGLARVLRAG